MKKLGYKGKKTFKILHITFIIIWVGGMISWLPLFASLQTNDFSTVYNTYLNMKSIEYHVMGWGQMGTFLTGLVLGIFTDWKIFKYNWVSVKFYTILAQIVFGVFFIQQKLLANISILESNADQALSDPQFLSNHTFIKYGIIIQLVVFFVLIWISFFKPLSQKEKSAKG